MERMMTENGVRVGVCVLCGGFFFVLSVCLTLSLSLCLSL